MPIEMFCSGCGKRMRAPDTAAGNQVRCPKCQTISVVPVPAGEPYYPPVESYHAPQQPAAFGDLGGLMDEADGHDYSMSVNLPPVPPPAMAPSRAPRAAVAKKRRKAAKTESSDEAKLAKLIFQIFVAIVSAYLTFKIMTNRR